MKTSEKIKKLMAEKQASKEEVAAKLKVSTRTVDHWLKDEKQPQPGNISEIDAWLNEPVPLLNEIPPQVFEKMKLEGSPDYVFKILDIQNKLLDEKYKSMRNEYMNAFKTMFSKAELINQDAFLVNSITSLEASVNVLSDLLLAHIAEGDKGRLNALKKEVDASRKKEVRDALEKHAASGEIKIS